jgi:hypothetical protein
MSLTKKILVSVLLLASLMVGALFLVSRISDSYGLAAAAIPASPTVVNSVGVVQYTLLVGSSHKLRSSEDPSCGTLTFLVKGAEGMDLVEVLLSKARLHQAWMVEDVLVGLGAHSSKSC